MTVRQPALGTVPTPGDEEDKMTAPSLAAPSSREAPPGELLICCRCLLLKGSVPGRTDGARQFCDCTPVEVRQAQPRWGGDFNTYAELCRCCGLVLIRSGSRWSVWFCASCKEAVALCDLE